MRRDGWTAEVTVAADTSKVPDGPTEAAKYAMDQVHHLASEWVKVEHHVAGVTETWLVDTSDGAVTHIGKTMSDPDREDFEPDPADQCEWATGSHYGGVFRLEDLGEDNESWLSCGNHLADSMGGHDYVMVSPHNENGDDDGRG